MQTIRLLGVTVIMVVKGKYTIFFIYMDNFFYRYAREKKIFCILKFFCIFAAVI